MGYALPNKGQPHLLSLIPSFQHYEPSSQHYERLGKIAAIRDKGRTNQELVEPIILELCSEHYLQLRTLADLLGRAPNSVRNHYVNPMLKQGLLEARYPDEPTHPQQAYRTLLCQGISNISDTSPSSQAPENIVDTSHPPTPPAP